MTHLAPGTLQCCRSTALANLGGVSATADEQLEAASWDLEPLVERRGPEAVEEMLTEARERAEAFSERYRGRVAELDEAELVEAMRGARRHPRPRPGGPAPTRC